jgi:histidinol-phosphate aminotransferase
LPAYNAGLSTKVVQERYGVTDVVRLASNESPFGACPAVSRALAHLADGVSIYPDANCSELRAAIAARLDISSSQVIVGNGSESILQMICQVFLSPGDRVLVQRPAFGLHEIYPRMMGAEVEFVELTPSLAFDTAAWCTALARGPKIAMIANPSNPVGCMFQAGDFDKLLESTPDRTLLVVDEAYWEYARLAPDFPDVQDLLRARRGPWIVLRTFSKAWGLAGLRVGYGFTSEADLVGLLDRVRTPFNVNMAAQIAALAAWGDPGFMEMATAETVCWRDELAADLCALGLRIAPSANGPINEALLASGIIVKPWKDAGFENFVRISIGARTDNARCVEALSKALKEPAAPRLC